MIIRKTAVLWKVIFHYCYTVIMQIFFCYETFEYNLPKASTKMKNFLASIIYLGILQKGGLATCNMKINLCYSGHSPLDYFRKRTILLHLNNTIIFTKQHKRREAIKLCNGLAYPTAMWKKLSFFALLEIVSKQYLATNT